MKKILASLFVLCSVFVGLVSTTAYAAPQHAASCTDHVIGDNIQHYTSPDSDSLFVESQQHVYTGCNEFQPGGVFKATGNCTPNQCDGTYHLQTRDWSSTSGGVPIQDVYNSPWYSLPNDRLYHGYGIQYITNWCSNGWGSYFVTEAVMQDYYGNPYTAWSSTPAYIPCLV